MTAHGVELVEAIEAILGETLESREAAALVTLAAGLAGHPEIDVAWKVARRLAGRLSPEGRKKLPPSRRAPLTCRRGAEGLFRDARDLHELARRAPELEERQLLLRAATNVYRLARRVDSQPAVNGEEFAL